MNAGSAKSGGGTAARVTIPQPVRVWAQAGPLWSVSSKKAIRSQCVENNDRRILSAHEPLEEGWIWRSFAPRAFNRGAKIDLIVAREPRLLRDGSSRNWPHRRALRDGGGPTDAGVSVVGAR
jgi:hypothetical protein